MVRHPIRKFFGLFVLYSLIILGIFALQFRSQSIFSKNFEQLRLTLSKNKEDNHTNPYENSFFIAYKGMTFFGDDENSSYITYGNGNKVPLVFKDWREIDDTSFELFFSENTSLLCKVGKDEVSLNMYASLPPKAVEMSIPYKFSRSYTVTDSSKKRMVLKSSNMQTALKAPEITDSNVLLFDGNKTLSYYEYIPLTRFTFDSIIDEPLAQTDLFMENKKNIKNAAVELFTGVVDTITEQSANAYMAEMTGKNKYLDGIAKIPDSYKKGTRRTFVSAPYLNNLLEMNNSLVMQMENLDYKMNYSIEKNDLSIFESDNLGKFLLTRKTSSAQKVLSIPSNQEGFEPSAIQAAGILNTYITLKKENSPLANILQPVLDQSLEIIETACVYDNNSLTITSNNEAVNRLQAVRIGKTLVDYGALTKNTTIQAGGYMLINSHIPAKEALDTRTTGEIYAILEEDNPLYPHSEIVANDEGSTIWAWTVAQNIDFKKDEEGSIYLYTKFPQGASHYMILNNIEPFNSIEIYGIKFRTDHRFETYNSSGYVYNARTKTLFLKYRHKSETELVKLIYKEEPEPEPVPEDTVLDANGENLPSTPVDGTVPSQSSTTASPTPMGGPAVNN